MLDSRAPTTTAPPEAPATDPPVSTRLRPAPRLDWTDRDGPKSVNIERRSLLGSAPHCDIVIADAAVSRVHAELEPMPEGIWIRDLKSRNGTFIEGVRVESASVGDGYRIRVGTTEILVDYASAEIKPVESWPSDHFGPLVGKSTVMRELFATLARLGPLDSSIMIAGETGTGKELVARAIHGASHRVAGPFVVVDCATLSETLIEAELFGHTKGAFTGAHQSRAGAIESANGGTVFLDEIGELPISMQPKLLRVLESSTVRRVGETKFREVNVRFLSATHRDLLAMVKRGEFREDLYFRLAVLPVRVPALRERIEDIELLVRHFSEGTGDWLTPKVLRALEARPWRGNVRELRNYAERARAIGASEALDFTIDAIEPEAITAVIPIPAAMLSSRTVAAPPPPAPVMPPLTTTSPSTPKESPVLSQPFRTFREQWIGYGERAFVQALLERHGNNVVAAAREAGIDRTYLYRLMRKHGL